MWGGGDTLPSSDCTPLGSNKSCLIMKVKATVGGMKEMRTTLEESGRRGVIVQKARGYTSNRRGAQASAHCRGKGVSEPCPQGCLGPYGRQRACALLL